MKDEKQIANEEFIEIYSRNIKRVYQISMLYLKNCKDAEDSAQMVFLKYLKNKRHLKLWNTKKPGLSE